MADILWHIAKHSKACESAPFQVQLVSELRDPDSLETAKIYFFDDKEAVKSFLSSDAIYTYFLSPCTSCPGVPAFLYSAILTRGLGRIIEEFQGKLVVEFGYCAQELVNLLLCARATPNCFDGDRQLDGYYLKGVRENCHPIAGMLTLYEFYGSMEVGRIYKNPEFPVWVICAESHYSTLWASDVLKGPATPPSLNFEDPTMTMGFAPLAALNPMVSVVDKPCKYETAEVELLYWDPLARNDERVRIRVSPLKQSSNLFVFPPSPDERLEGVIEKTLFTKWKESGFEWIDCERIL